MTLTALLVDDEAPARARLRQLLAGARPHHTVPARMEVLSATLVGCPYVAHGLVGSAAIPEHFTASLEGFDCVTYVETVLALARASDAAGFAEELRRSRGARHRRACRRTGRSRAGRRPCRRRR